MKAAIPFGNVWMLECVRSKKTNAILSFDGSPPDVFFHFSSGISVDVSLSRFHQTTLSLLSLVEPALTSPDRMCTVGQGEESRMHVKLICNFGEEWLRERRVLRMGGPMLNLSTSLHFGQVSPELHFHWSPTEMGKLGVSSSTNKLLSSTHLLSTAVTRWVRECKTA